MDPSNAQAKSGLKAVDDAIAREAREDGQDPDLGLGKMFNDPHLLAKIAANPTTKHLLADPTFMAKLQMVQRNPQLLQQEIMQDQRLMSVMAMLLGINMQAPGEPMQTDEPVVPYPKRRYWPVALHPRRCFCVEASTNRSNVHQVHHPPHPNLNPLKSQRAPPHKQPPKKPKQMTSKTKATQPTNPVTLTKPSPSTKRHGTHTRISRISITCRLRTLRRASMRRVLRRRSGQWTRGGRCVLISS